MSIKQNNIIIISETLGLGPFSLRCRPGTHFIRLHRKFGWLDLDEIQNPEKNGMALRKYQMFNSNINFHVSATLVLRHYSYLLLLY